MGHYFLDILYIVLHVSYITANVCILKITQTSQYRCMQLQYRFAVISEAPSTFDERDNALSGDIVHLAKRLTLNIRLWGHFAIPIKRLTQIKISKVKVIPKKFKVYLNSELTNSSLFSPSVFFPILTRLLLIKILKCFEPT